MLTDSVHDVRMFPRSTRDSAPAELSVPLARATDGRADAPATFSRVVADYHLSTTAIDTLIERLPLGVLVAARNGSVVYANEAARRLGADSVAPVRWALTHALLTEDPLSEEMLDLSEPGSPRRLLSMKVTPVRDATKAVTAAMLTLTDVTAAKQVAEWAPILDSLMNL